jgi:hypothetical protein
MMSSEKKKIVDKSPRSTSGGRAPLAIPSPLADSFKGGLRCAALVIPMKIGIQFQQKNQGRWTADFHQKDKGSSSVTPPLSSFFPGKSPFSGEKGL